MSAGRPPKIEDEQDLLHYYIGRYYQELSNNPVREDLEKHIELIESINAQYLTTLKKHEDFNYELWENRFKECIDFLTKVFTKKTEEEAQKQRTLEFMEETKKRHGNQ